MLLQRDFNTQLSDQSRELLKGIGNLANIVTDSRVDIATNHAETKARLEAIDAKQAIANGRTTKLEDRWVAQAQAGTTAAAALQRDVDGAKYPIKSGGVVDKYLEIFKSPWPWITGCFLIGCLAWVGGLSQVAQGAMVHYWGLPSSNPTVSTVSKPPL